MKNVSVRWKMIILALITLIGTLAIGVLAVNRMLVMEEGSESVLRTSIEDDYDENIKNQVDNAISMLDAVYAGYENGDYSYEEAETRGADLLRELRYGDGGYFWADTYDGDNVVLLGSETEGTNRMETKDAEGYQMVKEIIRVGQEPDGGYTDYVSRKKVRRNLLRRDPTAGHLSGLAGLSERETILTISMRLLRKKRRQCGRM